MAYKDIRSIDEQLLSMRDPNDDDTFVFPYVMAQIRENLDAIRSRQLKERLISDGFGQDAIDIVNEVYK